MESEEEVKYWIGGTTDETGFHSILFARFYPRGDPGRVAASSLVQISFPERDPDRRPVGISAGICENTGEHSRG